MALLEFSTGVVRRQFDKLDDMKKALTNEQPDIIIIDSMLNGRSNLETLKEFRQSAPNAKIILIVSSGAKKDDIIGFIKDKTVHGVIVRPITIQQLIDNISRLTGLNNPTERPWYMMGN